MNIVNFLKRFGNDNSGATAIEYGLIVSLIVIGSIGAFDVLANENTGIWATVSNRVTDVL
ncbi:MAG: pilus assembly protein [Erythrobacter sp. RIFCSPHIGHO2_12_FULL_63_10]|nr:MAG: pilus assembly protein [Erythrobacter sp. RIFCSPHIGHO2_12_FULL_63_10]